MRARINSFRRNTGEQSYWLPKAVVLHDQQSVSTLTSEAFNKERTQYGHQNFSTPQPLSGRSEETQTLLQAYQSLSLCEQGGASSNKKRIVVVHGSSGCGKTSLVDTLREPVTDSHGYFVAGKFFQSALGVTHHQQERQQHSPIIAAFSDLCDLMLQFSDTDQIRQMRIRLQEALGADSNLLVTAISNLSPFLDHDDSELGRVDTNDATVRANFKVACLRFLNAMASAQHPVVLFLDDVQWMDEESHQLIEMMLDDNYLNHVMLIFAYREEEADSIVDLFSSRTTDTIDIAVGNLETAHVHQMVSTFLGTNNSQVVSLSNLIAVKDDGEPLPCSSIH